MKECIDFRCFSPRAEQNKSNHVGLALAEGSKKRKVAAEEQLLLRKCLLGTAGTIPYSAKKTPHQVLACIEAFSAVGSFCPGILGAFSGSREIGYWHPISMPAF